MASPDLMTALGAVAAVLLASAGSAYGSAHGGMFAVRTVDYLGRMAFIPIMQAGVLAIYGLVMGYLLSKRIDFDPSSADGYRNLASGLAVGAACLCSGVGMGLFLRIHNCHRMPLPSPGAVPAGRGDADPLLAAVAGDDHPLGQNPKKKFITLVMSLIFLESIGLYGLVVALFLMAKAPEE